MSRGGHAGFSLLELTVSLAISALALIGLTHLVQDAAGLDARLGHSLRSAGEAEALFAVLEQLLADPELEIGGEARRLAGGSGRPSVSGDARAITIVSRGPPVLGLLDPTTFTLAFEAGPAPDRGRILLTWWTSAGISEPEIVAQARDFTLRYAAVGGTGDITWVETWSQPVAALALIEARYIEVPSGRRASRIIPVVPSLPRICVLQPLLEGCPTWR